MSASINFKAEALDFVRKHNCVANVPVELIQDAMEHGAGLILGHFQPLIKNTVVELEKKRLESKPHKNQTKLIPIENPTA